MGIMARAWKITSRFMASHAKRTMLSRRHLNALYDTQIPALLSSSYMCECCNPIFTRKITQHFSVVENGLGKGLLLKIIAK
jgi:hypothetical protein